MSAAESAVLPVPAEAASPRAAPLPRWLPPIFGLLVFLGCLAPAVFNRFPLVFPDTEGYMIAAEGFRPSHLRGFGYGAFLRATGGLLSLWGPVLAQAALAAWLTTRLLVLEAAFWRPGWRIAAAAGLLVALLAGHLPWLAAWVQPDVFTGLMLLAIWLLVLHGAAMSWLERGLTFLFLVGGVTTHLTHPLLLLGLGLFTLLLSFLPTARRVQLRLMRREGPRWVPTAGRLRRAAVVCVAAAGLGWAALVGANWITYRVPATSLAGPVFLFARLQADTDAARALRPLCEQERGPAVCDQLHRLGLTADEFLWRDHSPLPHLGFISGFWPEAQALNPVLLREGWGPWLAESGRRAVRQLASTQLGDGLDAEGPSMLVEGLPKHGFSPVADQLVATRQIVDGVRPLLPRILAEPLAMAGLLLLAGLAVYGLRRRRPSVWWPALLVLAWWLGNAALIALGGEVHGRYAARVLCVVPFLAGLVLLRALTRRPAEAVSGT